MGDVDGDGDLDIIVAGGKEDYIRLYLNNGSDSPFDGVDGIPIFEFGVSLAIGDIDGDGDLDVIAGNSSAPNRLYLNNGTANPFENVNGMNISNDQDDTRSIKLGDVDGDGDLDVIAGNLGANRLYLNNGTVSHLKTLMDSI